LEYADELPVIDPTHPDEEERVRRYAEIYWKQHQRKGMTMLESLRLMRTRNYFGAMMVREGDADALLTGYSRSFPSTFRPLLQVAGTDINVKKISSTVLLMTNKGPIFISDAPCWKTPRQKNWWKLLR